MTTFILTSMDDDRAGGEGTDIFEGPGGGNDVSRGNGSNDTFNIQYTQTGAINGGAGHDQIRMVGGSYMDLNSNSIIKDVEEPIVDSGALFAKLDQLSGFTRFNVNNDLDYFSISLHGDDGSLDPGEGNHRLAEPMRIRQTSSTASMGC